MIEKLLPSFGIVIIFACLVAYHYIRDLRQMRDHAGRTAEDAWKAYERVNNELCALKGQPLPPSLFSDKSRRAEGQEDLPQGFKPGRIGPTAINDSEMMRGRTDASMRAPVNSPSPADIAAAVNAAKQNGELN